MLNVDFVGCVLKLKADNLDDAAIEAKVKDKGFDPVLLPQVMNAIEEDEVLVVNSLFYKTFLNPVTYIVGVRKISVERRIFEGLMRKNEEIGIRTIDKVNIEEDLISADVVIVHSDQSEVRISDIAKHDARQIQKFFGYVIEAQRIKVINIASD